MRFNKWLLIIGIQCISVSSFSQSPFAHDPVMIKQDGSYYMFCTGWGISSFSSTDMINWTMEKPVFKSAPEWAVKEIPGYRGHTWAPDIMQYRGKYYLFYSVSAFGKNTSCIGMAENVTLNPKSPEYKWIDHGKIIQSVPGRDNWNAIDPNLILDEKGNPWLSFGSFWSGIKLVKLADDLSGIAQPEEWYGIASRPRDQLVEEKKAGDGAIEAPFIFKHDNYYYLFVSFDYCCRGIESDYKIMVGRSETITGPYLDKEGMSMLYGGGSLVLEGNKNWPGVGHCAIYNFDCKDVIVFHGYDAMDEGKSKLLIRDLIWDEAGWPTAKL